MAKIQRQDKILQTWPPLDCWLLHSKGEPVKGWSIKEKKFVTYKLQRVLGAGGKGVVFLAKKQATSDNSDDTLSDLSEDGIYVLKFPRFDFSYLDNKDSPRKRLKLLRDYLAERTEEFNREYDRSQRLLAGYSVAHLTIDLLSITYQFTIGDEQPSLSLRIGVQAALDSDNWVSLDDLRMPWVPEVTLNTEKTTDWTIDFKREWLPLARGIAKVIETVHRRRVVHGDIWAPNVFVARHLKLSDRNALKLIDFGNAWSTEFVSAQLGGGRRDNYAPPEERRALLPKSQASDGFAYGVLLLWLLVGPDVSPATFESTSDKQRLLLAYLRRKRADKTVRELLDSSNEVRKVKGRACAPDLVHALITKQLRVLVELDPSLATLTETHFSKSVMANLLEDEEVLRKHLRRTLEEEYSDSKAAVRNRARSVDQDIEEWETSLWLKGRMYRPCESMIYDPGEVNIENAASQRKYVRERISKSIAGAPIYREHPWIVDIISHCVSSDQARRPRMIDTLRDLETYSEPPPDIDPLQVVIAHRCKT